MFFLFNEFIPLILKRKKVPFTKRKVCISTAQCHKAKRQWHIKFVQGKGQSTHNNEQNNFYSSL